MYRLPSTRSTIRPFRRHQAHDSGHRSGHSASHVSDRRRHVAREGRVFLTETRSFSTAKETAVDSGRIEQAFGETSLHESRLHESRHWLNIPRDPDQATGSRGITAYACPVEAVAVPDLADAADFAAVCPAEAAGIGTTPELGDGHAPFARTTGDDGGSDPGNGTETGTDDPGVEAIFTPTPGPGQAGAAGNRARGTDSARSMSPPGARARKPIAASAARASGLREGSRKTLFANSPMSSTMRSYR